MCETIKSNKQSGVAAVEFAIVLPLLVLLFAGIIEFSLLLYNQQVITNASREGARAAINPSSPFLQGEEDRSILNEEEVESIVVEYCKNKLVTFGDPESPKVTLSPNSFEDRELGNDVIVQVEYDYKYLLPKILGLGTSRKLISTTTMAMM